MIPTRYKGYFTDTCVDITPTGVLNFNNGPKATDLNKPLHMDNWRRGHIRRAQRGICMFLFNKKCMKITKAFRDHRHGGSNLVLMKTNFII